MSLAGTRNLASLSPSVTLSGLEGRGVNVTVATRDQKLYDKLIDLKRHLRTCATCMAAKKARDLICMCQLGLRLTVDAAMLYDDLIKLKIAAHAHPGHIIYACPDKSKHGKAFELTAYPYVATGIQDALF